ncbi:uncharacterized protein DS421_18g625940 [Arachis hypogaea]|nr:uncharacterized protein DS421_18g625940 [Arachis hypogaea]
MATDPMGAGTCPPPRAPKKSPSPSHIHDGQVQSAAVKNRPRDRVDGDGKMAMHGDAQICGADEEEGWHARRSDANVRSSTKKGQNTTRKGKKGRRKVRRQRRFPRPLAGFWCATVVRRLLEGERGREEELGGVAVRGRRAAEGSEGRVGENL